MRKVVRRVGTSTGVIFNKEEQQVFSLSLGQVIQFEPVLVNVSKEADFAIAKSPVETFANLIPGTVIP